MIEVVRWNAVATRSSEADGQFYYAVRTTGVFCRPSCGSRKPLPKNVEFFESAEDAIRAGYRPCKRCRPDDRGSRNPAERVMMEACRLLSLHEPIQTREVAEALGLSASYFQRCFKRHLGVTPQQYRRRALAERGRQKIAEARSVTESVYETGYSSSSRFYAGLGRELGMKPSVARRGGEGETIQYATATCSLGRILIAWTRRGVCEVALASTPDDLFAQLQAHFPRAILETSRMNQWVQAVIESVETGSSGNIPIELRGTAFQERVWRELRKIPEGELRTYSEIAEAVGRPSAARAVARACAANPLAVLVPCHRVVRKDGEPSGYRWGLERKDELLRRESGSTRSR